MKKINDLIKDIERNGLLKGSGKPEALKYIKACSRHINDEHRLVYNKDNNIKDKLNKYDLDESEPIYSLRLDNKTRIYGFIADDIFYILAYDDEHELYKVHKSHT